MKIKTLEGNVESVTSRVMEELGEFSKQQTKYMEEMTGVFQTSLAGRAEELTVLRGKLDSLQGEMTEMERSGQESSTQLLETASSHIDKKRKIVDDAQELLQKRLEENLLEQTRLSEVINETLQGIHSDCVEWRDLSSQFTKDSLSSLRAQSLNLTKIISESVEKITAETSTTSEKCKTRHDEVDALTQNSSKVLDDFVDDVVNIVKEKFAVYKTSHMNVLKEIVGRSSQSVNEVANGNAVVSDLGTELCGAVGDALNNFEANFTTSSREFESAVVNNANLVNEKTVSIKTDNGKAVEMITSANSKLSEDMGRFGTESAVIDAETASQLKAYIKSVEDVGEKRKESIKCFSGSVDNVKAKSEVEVESARKTYEASKNAMTSVIQVMGEKAFGGLSSVDAAVKTFSGSGEKNPSETFSLYKATGATPSKSNAYYNKSKIIMNQKFQVADSDDVILGKAPENSASSVPGEKENHKSSAGVSDGPVVEKHAEARSSEKRRAFGERSNVQ